VGLLLVSTPLVYPRESAAFEKTRDGSAGERFAMRISCIGEPATPDDIDPDLITAAELVSLPSKTGRFQIT
jgi:hypothetical protein